jgi:cytochrome c peroxidase
MLLLVLTKQTITTSTMKNQLKFLLPLLSILLFSCNKDDEGNTDTTYPAAESLFAGVIDFSALPNYANQVIPNYIDKDNTDGNPITDEGATLGRILFYDKNLSVNNTIACGSCHKQQSAFGDNETSSTGVNGSTGRHSMRLINARFADEENFFWDERANSLEEQTTQPIQDHAEMGYSGQNGDPGITDLITKLEALDHYPELFTMAFGDDAITESRMQLALAQFIRSIQSFDSKFDTGLMTTGDQRVAFGNFTAAENRGKNLFFAPPAFTNGQRTGGGSNCAVCHRGPEFDIAPNSRNNGVTTTINPDLTEDFDNTRSPSLRDIFDAQGSLNGGLMHDASFSTIEAVIEHYNDIGVNNPNLDNRLRPQGMPQSLNLTAQEISDLSAFLRTLSGTNVYTDSKWSDPFTG